MDDDARGDRLPAVFVSHGAPTLALDRVRGADFRRWGGELRKPKAILVVSAHWEETPLHLGTVRPRELLYDFGGFPDELYRLRYAAPGAPDLAARVAELLPGIPTDDSRMWDHGVYVPLVHMRPDADVPVLEVSLPSRLGPEGVFELGRALRPLRDEGVLLLASGGLVHNLRRLDWSETQEPPEWATAFEAWVKDALRAREFGRLLALNDEAPALHLAHPTHEHLLPLFALLGAAHDGDEVAFPIEGFEYGSLSRTAVQLG